MLSLPPGEPSIAKVQDRLNYMAQTLYRQHVAGRRDLREARVDREDLTGDFGVTPDAIDALVRWGVLVEEDTFEPGKLDISGRKYRLSTEQICYLAYRMSNLDLAQETANASLPNLREDLNRRRRLLLRIASRKAPAASFKGEAGLSLPPIDPPTLIPRIFGSLRDGTLKSYAVFGELEQTRRELYEVNRQIERLCADEATKGAECAASLTNPAAVNGPQFEQLVGEALRVLGLGCRHIGGSGGLDLAVDSPVRVAVECKNLERPGKAELYQAGLELQRLAASEPWDLRWVVFASQNPSSELVEELNRTYAGSVQFLPSSFVVQALDLHRKYLLEPHQAVWACIRPGSLRLQLVSAYGTGEERPLEAIP